MEIFKYVYNNCYMAEFVPEKLSWCQHEQVYQGLKCIRCYEWSDRLDSAVCANIPLQYIPSVIHHPQTKGNNTQWPVSR